MKKILLALMISAFALFSAQESDAQNVMNKGSNVVNLGIGGYFGNGNWLTLNGVYDHGIVGNLFDSRSAFSLGAAADFSVFRHGSSVYIGPRAAVHYHFVPRLDTYLALTLGYGHAFYNDGYAPRDVSGGFGWDLSLGARYMFTPTLGGFVEFGHGRSNVRLGAAFKF